MSLTDGKGYNMAITTLEVGDTVVRISQDYDPTWVQPFTVWGYAGHTTKGFYANYDSADEADEAYQAKRVELRDMILRVAAQITENL